MFKEKDEELNNRLDKLGEQVMRATEITDQEIDARIRAPFIYTRIRANIEAQQRQINAWQAIIALGRYMILALSLVVLALFSLSWSMTHQSYRSNNIAATNPISQQSPAFVCSTCKESAIAGNGCSVTNIETLTSIFIRDEQGGK